MAAVLEQESGETVAVRGKDVQFKYWENEKKAKFTVYRPSADFAMVRRCGKTHYPPNAETKARSEASKKG